MPASYRKRYDVQRTIDFVVGRHVVISAVVLSAGLTLGAMMLSAVLASAVHWNLEKIRDVLTLGVAFFAAAVVCIRALLPRIQPSEFNERSQAPLPPSPPSVQEVEVNVTRHRSTRRRLLKAFSEIDTIHPLAEDLRAYCHHRSQLRPADVSRIENHILDCPQCKATTASLTARIDFYKQAKFTSE